MRANRVGKIRGDDGMRRSKRLKAPRQDPDVPGEIRAWPWSMGVSLGDFELSPGGVGRETKSRR